jgi:hypothetical protein
VRRFADAPSHGWRSLAARMAVVQALGFVALEVVERIVVRAPVAGVVAVLPVGFAVEAIVAAGLAALLCLTVAAAGVVARVLAGRPQRRVSATRTVPIPAASDDVRALLELLASNVSLRGPPAHYAA